MSQSSWQMGKHRRPVKAPSIGLNVCTLSIPWIIVCRRNRRLKSWYMFGRVRNPLSKTPYEGNNAECEHLMFPIADGTVKLSGWDHGIRRSTSTRDQLVRSEELSGDLQGISDTSQPTDEITDDGEARDDFWSIQGNCAEGRDISNSTEIRWRGQDYTKKPWVCCKQAVETIIGTLMRIETFRIYGPDSRSSQYRMKDVLTDIWSGRRLTKVQATTRLDYSWPQMWTGMSKASQRKEKQQWAIEKPKLDNAIKVEKHLLSWSGWKRVQRNLKNARKSWKIQWKPLRLVRFATTKRSFKHRETDMQQNQKIEACMHRRSSRVYENAFGKNSAFRSWRSYCWKGVQFVDSLQRCAQVFLMPQAMKIQELQKRQWLRNARNWKTLAWKESKVRDKRRCCCYLPNVSRPPGRRRDSVWKTIWRTIHTPGYSVWWLNIILFLQRTSEGSTSLVWKFYMEYSSDIQKHWENLERRYFGRRHWGAGKFGKVGRIRNWSSKNQIERSIDITKRKWIHIPSGRWYSKIVWKRLRIPRTHSRAGTTCKEWRSRRTSRRTGRVSTDRSNRWRWCPCRLQVDPRWLHLSSSQWTPSSTLCAEGTTIPYSAEIHKCNKVYSHLMSMTTGMWTWIQVYQSDFCKGCGPGRTDKDSSNWQTTWECVARSMDPNWKSRSNERKARKWANEKPKLDKARRLRGIYFIDPEDGESKETIKKRKEKAGRSNGGGDALQKRNNEALGATGLYQKIMRITSQREGSTRWVTLLWYTSLIRCLKRWKFRMRKNGRNSKSCRHGKRPK